MTNTQYIQQIIRDITIDPQRNIIHKGKPYGGTFNNAYVQQPSTKMLFQALESLIYSAYYNKNTAVAATTPPAYTDIMSFMNNLSAHNTTVEGFDEGWTIENIDMQGQIIARKGNLKRSVYAGEFVSSTLFHQKPMVNAGIKLIARKEHKDPSAGFYYVFGRTQGEDNMDQLVRVYFNLQPAGAAALILLLTQHLNERQIPFSFKCLQHPFYYTRCDTAVLYFDKRYSPPVFDVLELIWPAIKGLLNVDYPAFTKKLGPGISFAENPLKADESFGTHCSKMIAQGIMNAYTKGQPPATWLAEIKHTIEQKHGYASMDALHLNPKTKFPYQFPQLTA